MADDEAQIERVAHAIIVHMDVFDNCCGKFPPMPASSSWDEYSRVEQAAARLAAQSAVAAINGSPSQSFSHERLRVKQYIQNKENLSTK